MNPLDRAPHLLALRPMLRCAFIGFALFITFGCSSDVLTTKVPCLTDSDCGSSQSCFQDACTDDFSIISGLPCDQSRQCEGGNTCFEFFCTPGCTDVYYTSDCPQDYFCKPTSHAYATNESGERSLLGECAASECTSDGDCGTNETCVELALNLAACVPACTYGFNGDTYEDTCAREDGLPHDCHPLGSTKSRSAYQQAQAPGRRPGKLGAIRFVSRVRLAISA